MRHAAVIADERALLAEIVQRLVSALAPDRIYLFGSHARGDAGPDSDVDVLVLVSRPREELGELTGRAYAALSQVSRPVDVVVMNADRFEWLSGAAASLAAAVKREGRLLYAP